MKYRPPLEVRTEHVIAQFTLHQVHYPYVQAEAFEDSQWIALSWGDRNGDPVWYVEVTLTGTRLGRALYRVAEWRWQRRRRRQVHAA